MQISDHRKLVFALREKAKVGPKTFQQLLLAFGSIESIFYASKEQLCGIPRINNEKANQILQLAKEIDEIENEIQKLEDGGIELSTILDENYPQILKQISDPPPMLYYKGEFPVESKKFVAVVGTHHATGEGIGNAVRMGKNLASRDVVVVSGLARGIDSAGHLGAVTAGGKTYAVLGSGFNHIYPPENLPLSDEITRNGALLSEYNPNVPINVGQLMARNRIVVGLSQAVIVVEMEERSMGTEDAILRTVEQGKPLFVCKGNRNIDFLVEKGAVPISGEDDLDLVVNYIF